MQVQFSLPKPLSPLSKPPFPRKNRLPVSSMAACSQQLVITTNMYDLLAVTESAGPDEIKAAYRRQARRWHPDTCRSNGDKQFFAQQFMKAREAYRVLSDPVLREDYDFALKSGFPPPANWAAFGGGGPPFRKGRSRDWGFGDWESQLEGLKGRSSRCVASSWGSRMRTAHCSGPSD